LLLAAWLHAFVGMRFAPFVMALLVLRALLGVFLAPLFTVLVAFLAFFGVVLAPIPVMPIAARAGIARRRCGGCGIGGKRRGARDKGQGENEGVNDFGRSDHAGTPLYKITHTVLHGMPSPIPAPNAAAGM
jgi:hypothetical protein